MFRRNAALARLYHDELESAGLPADAISRILAAWFAPRSDNRAIEQAQKQVAEATAELVKRAFPEDDEQE